jgi:GntR family transcriptional regulator / MocR family aminotransferase
VDLHVTLGGRGDLAARIYRQLLDAVLDGRLRAGEKLPPTRELAGRLDVSRNTVAAAYERLTAEGFLVGRVGAGTFVSGDPAAVPARPARVRVAPGGREVRPRRLWESLADSGWDEPHGWAYDFGAGVPDGRLFPLETWRRLVGRELRPSAVRSATYGEPAGHAGLRAAIARHVGVARSVRAGADDVIVTQGAQQALDLIGRVLVEPGTCVAVEEPGYPPARQLFHSLGARVAGVPVDGEGLEVAAIPRAAKLVYTTPSHQFPLGTPMSLARRTALLTWAERRGAVVVEDDYDSEFRFSDRPLEPLQSLDRAGRVVYVGTFSKTMLPTLRMGFLVAPASLRDVLRRAKRLTDWHGEPHTQAALARFIDDGLLARHVRKVSREYAARHERIVATLERDFADWLQLVPSAAGLHLCARVRPGATVEVDDVVRRAREVGVGVQTLATFCAEVPSQPGVVLGYGAIARDRVDEGLHRLASCFAGRTRARGPGPRAAGVSRAR